MTKLEICNHHLDTFRKLSNIIKLQCENAYLNKELVQGYAEANFRCVTFQKFLGETHSA